MEVPVRELFFLSRLSGTRSILLVRYDENALSRVRRSLLADLEQVSLVRCMCQWPVSMADRAREGSVKCWMPLSSVLASVGGKGGTLAGAREGAGSEQYFTRQHSCPRSPSAPLLVRSPLFPTSPRLLIIPLSLYDLAACRLLLSLCGESLSLHHVCLTAQPRGPENG